MRLLKIAGSDLSVFDFDYDQTWAGFFLDADENILGRYGGRDATGPDGRLSLKGLRYAMQSALLAHKNDRPTPASRQKSVFAEQFPAAKRMSKGECIHCHQVYEFMREQRQTEGVWKRDELWRYPLPENVGLSLDVDQGNKVTRVLPDSAVAKLGLQSGDLLQRVNGVRVGSQADVQYGLHLGPWQGKIDVVWQRQGKRQSGQLQLAAGWKKTNVTWRPSMLDILPAITVYGEDLSSDEKKKLGLAATRLAIRQEEKVHSHAQAAGVRAGDVIIGVNDEIMNLTGKEFFAYIRRNHLVGERISLQILRDGKKLSVVMTLK